MLLMDCIVSTEEVYGDGCVRGKEILRLIYCSRLALHTVGYACPSHAIKSPAPVLTDHVFVKVTSLSCL